MKFKTQNYYKKIKCSNECIKKTRFLQKTIQNLEKENMLIKKENGGTNVNSKKREEIDYEGLKSFKSIKILEQKLKCCELRIEKLIGLKNDLIKENFVY